MPTRRLADAVVFKVRTGVSIPRMPEVFGARRDLARLMLGFIRIGGLRALVDEVGKKDPEWLDGLDLKGIGALLRKHEKATSKAVISRKEVAKEAARDGRFRITDEQWEAVRDLVPPSVLYPHGRDKRPFDARMLLDGILLKLWTRVGFRNMPPEWGRPWELQGSTKALVWTGNWEHIVNVWKAMFPEMLHGLPLHLITRFGKFYPRNELRDRAIRARRNEVSAIVLRNIEECMGAAARERGFVVLRGRPSVHTALGKFLKPNLVIARSGRRPKSNCCDQPSVVVRILDPQQPLDDQARLQRYRLAPGVEHILSISPDALRVQHHWKNGHKWSYRVVKAEDDQLDIGMLSVSVNIGSLYRDTGVVRAASL